MNRKKQNGGRYAGQKWLSLRVTQEEKKRIAEYAAFFGLSVSEYMRRRILGGRLPIPKTDALAIRELRRLGGLLKHNFEALRQVGADRNLFQTQGDLLRDISTKIEKLGRICNDSEENQDKENDQDQGAADR